MSTNIGKDGCSKFDRSGVEKSNLCWVGLMVNRVVGACKKQEFEIVRRSRFVLASGDASRMDDEVRTLKRSIVAEDAEHSSEQTTVESEANADMSDVAGSDAELMLFQIDDIGVASQSTLGHLPNALAKTFCSGIAAHMDIILHVGYTAMCDYNASVSFGNGIEHGHSHSVAIDSMSIGAPDFNSCRTLVCLIGMACVWSAMEVLPVEQGQLKGTSHLSLPCEKCRLPRPTVTPCITLKPSDMTETSDDIAACRVLAQRAWWSMSLREKRNGQLER